MYTKQYKSVHYVHTQNRLHWLMDQNRTTIEDLGLCSGYSRLHLLEQHVYSDSL